jgi:hypothetical protein
MRLSAQIKAKEYAFIPVELPFFGGSTANNTQAVFWDHNRRDAAGHNLLGLVGGVGNAI